jgi:hypothetical protein
MKRFIFNLICLLCLNMALYAQTGTAATAAAPVQQQATQAAQQPGESTKLSAKQWDHCLALIAHQKTHGFGYGLPDKDFPEDYNMAYIDSIYRKGNPKNQWTSTYDYYKAHLSQPGDLKQLQSLITGYHPEATNTASIMTLVKQYLQKHPDVVQPKAQQAPKAQKAAQAQQPAKVKAAINFQLIINILLALIAIDAIAVAMFVYSKFKELRAYTGERSHAADKRIAKLEADLDSHVAQISKNEERIAAVEKAQRETPKPVKQHVEKDKEVEEKEEDLTPHHFFMPRPESSGIFHRASESFQPGNSIYEMTTPDGTTGTFWIIDNSDVHASALMMPTENLMPACYGDSIRFTNGMNRIITDMPGKVKFENGHWHVTDKARIHYER